jgi:hypothetical protein
MENLRLGRERRRSKQKIEMVRKEQSMMTDNTSNEGFSLDSYGPL